MTKFDFRSIEINGNLYFTQHWHGQISLHSLHTLHTLHSVLIIKMVILQIKIFNEINFF